MRAPPRREPLDAQLAAGGPGRRGRRCRGPRPVDPPALAPRSSTASGIGDPRAAVLDGERTRPSLASTTHRVGRALGGVGEDVAQQHVDRGRGVVRGQPHEVGPGRARSCTTTSGRRRRPARPRTRPDPAATAARSHRTATASCSGRRAARISSLTSASRRSTSSSSAAAPWPSASRRRAVSGVRSRCERSATRSRSAASSSSMRSARRLRASATSSISGGPPASARAVESPPASARLVRARSAAGPGDAAGQLVGGDDRQDEQADGDHGQHGPRRRDALGELVPRGPARAARRRPPSPTSTGRNTSTPVGGGAREGDAARGPAPRRPGRPGSGRRSCVPSGRSTLSRPSRPAAVRSHRGLEERVVGVDREQRHGGRGRARRR